MKVVSLPNNQSATIRSRGEITERASRKISRARMASMAVMARLVNAGFDESKVETWSEWNLNDEDSSALDGFQSTLIAEMVTEWTLGEPPTSETALDLESATFDALVKACDDEFNQVDDFTPDGVVNPKAPTAD